jgi:hypothetical protein
MPSLFLTLWLVVLVLVGTCCAEEEAQGLGLRQQGNDAYKAGELRQALKLYWKAAQHNPQDYALYSNISLVALKLGDAKEVRCCPDCHSCYSLCT